MAGTRARELIVNADDFGRSEGTNEGIVRAHEEGIVTSASLMVCRAAAESAAECARARPRLSVGLHVDLEKWSRHVGGAVLVDEDAPVDDEVAHQLELFRSLTGADPTHLDSHHHVHREEPAASAVAAVARALDVPLRGAGAIRYAGEFYGAGAIGVDALIGVVTGLAPGIAELGCHPGLDLELDSSYRVERPREVQALCDPRVRAAIEQADVRLRSFRGLSYTGQ